MYKHFMYVCVCLCVPTLIWLPNFVNFLVILGSQHPFSFDFLFHVNLISVKCKGQSSCCCCCYHFSCTVYYVITFLISIIQKR